MNIMRLALVSILVLSTAACSPSAEEPVQEPVATETPISVEPDGGIGDGAGPIPDRPGSIPVRFQGVWDYVGGTCSPESDMRMEIKGREILYYESIGQVSGIGTEGDDALVDLVMEGEGEQWVQVSRLSLSNDGKTLSVTDGEEPKLSDQYPRKKCPA